MPRQREGRQISLKRYAQMDRAVFFELFIRSIDEIRQHLPAVWTCIIRKLVESLQILFPFLRLSLSLSSDACAQTGVGRATSPKKSKGQNFGTGHQSCSSCLRDSRLHSVHRPAALEQGPAFRRQCRRIILCLGPPLSLIRLCQLPLPSKLSESEPASGCTLPFTVLPKSHESLTQYLVDGHL